MNRALVSTLAFVSLPLLITGCSMQTTATNAVQQGVAIPGSMHGGQQPITGAHVYLMSVSMSGYGRPATSLLVTGDGSDNIGTYVTTDAAGGFQLTGKYSCTPGSEVYVLGLGGKSSPTSAANPGIALMAALGKCPASNTLAALVPFANVDEVTTVAGVYALSGFMTGPAAASTSGTTLASTALDNAFATAAGLADLASGTAKTAVGSNGTAPASKVNTLANIIASCINTDGTTGVCSSLYNNAPNGFQTPSDTITALLNIAHNPGANVMALYNLVTPQSPFQPMLATAPNDFALGIRYTTPNLNSPQNLSVDSSGNVWLREATSSTNAIEKLSPTGTVLSGATGYLAGGPGGGDSIALDAQGNAFLGNRSGFSIYKLSPAGTLLSPANGFGGSCSNPGATIYAVSVDASGNVLGSGSGGCLLKISNLGTVLSGNGYPSTADDSYALAVDSSNSAWITGMANSVVRRVTANGMIAADYGSAVSTPYSIAIDRNDTVFVANHTQNSVTHLISTGAFSLLTGGGVTTPNELSLDGSSNVWVANNSNHISAFTNGGAAITSASGYEAASSGTARSLAIDGSGNVWVGMNGPDIIVELVGLATPAARPVMPPQLGIRP